MVLSTDNTIIVYVRYSFFIRIFAVNTANVWRSCFKMLKTVSRSPVCRNVCNNCINRL